jgi:metal-dependent hydrolase (beta-lactamase superfamily II)
VRYVLVLLLAACSHPSELDKLRHQLQSVQDRAQAVVAGAHTDAERRAARHTLVDLQLELADLSQRIDRLQSPP